MDNPQTLVLTLERTALVDVVIPLNQNVLDRAAELGYSRDHAGVFAMVCDDHEIADQAGTLGNERITGSAVETDYEISDGLGRTERVIA